MNGCVLRILHDIIFPVWTPIYIIPNLHRLEPRSDGGLVYYTTKNKALMSVFAPMFPFTAHLFVEKNTIIESVTLHTSPPIGEGVFICLFSSQVSIRTTSYQWWTCHSGDSHASLLRVSMSGGAAIRSRMTAASEKAARPFPSPLLMKNENTPKSSLCNQRTGQKESTESHVNKVLHVEKGLSGYLEPPKVNPSHRDTCLCDTRPSRRLMRCGWTFSFDEMTANCYSEADCIMIKTIKVVFTRWRHLRMCRQRRGRSGCTSFVSSLSDRLADSWVCVSKILPQISLPWKGGRHSLRLDSATGGIL